MLALLGIAHTCPGLNTKRHFQMLMGHLDALTTAGFAKGWACENSAPGRSLVISIQSPDGEVAAGFAYEFRHDVAAARIGYGWCGFTLRLNAPHRTLRRQTLKLVLQGSGALIHESRVPRLMRERRPVAASMEALLEADPMTLKSIEQLEACEPLFTAFIDLHGHEAFVRAAYTYVLQRKADDGGLSLYTQALQRAELTPFRVLRIFAHSEEFGSRPRLLSSPPNASFPFRLT